MAGLRLEYWMTLPRKVLKERVAAEMQRRDLTFAEQQCLSAAQEALSHWREPRPPRTKGKFPMVDDPKVEEAKPDAPAQPEEKKEVKAKKARASGKKKAAAGTNSKKAKKTVAKAKAGNRSRLDPEAKVTWTGKENPYRESSEVWERVETVRKSSGQTVKTVQGKEGVKPSTLTTLKRMGLISIK